MKHDVLKNLSNQELHIISKQSGILICRYYMETGAVENLFDSPEERFGITEVQEGVADFVITNGIVSADTKDEYLHLYELMNEGIPVGKTDIKFKLSDGKYHWHHVNYTLIYDENQKPLYSLITFFDNTKEREMELAAEKWHTSLASVLSEAILYAEFNLSKNAVERIEDKTEEIKQKDQMLTLEDVIEYVLSEDIDKKEKEELNLFFKRERLLGLFNQNVHEDHIDFYVNLNHLVTHVRANVQMIKYPHLEDVMAIISFVKIENNYAHIEELSHKAFHDALTGILNREGIEQRSEERLLKYNPQYNTALFIIDLDNFKQINDCLGHQVGDLVLKQVAKAISDSFYPSDIIGRLGGDEFIVLITGDFDSCFLKKKATQLLSQMKLDKGIKKEVSISASIGVAFGHGKMTFEKLYRISDIALYSAKRAGKACFHLIDADTNEEEKLINHGLQKGIMSLQSLIDYSDNQSYSKTKTPYEALLENIPGGVVVLILNESGLQIVHCNEWSARLTGYSSKEIEKREKENPFAFVHPDDLEEYNKIIEKMKNGLDNINFTYRVRHRNGRYIHIVLNATITERYADEMIYYGVYTDVEEMVQVQKELEYSRKKLDAIINAVPGGIAIIEISDDIYINYSSDWIYHFTGFNQEEYDKLRQGSHLYSVYDEDLPLIQDTIKNLKTGQHSVHVSVRLKHKDGSLKWIDIHGYVIEFSKDKVVFYAIFMPNKNM